jgi:hypothetical protein
VSLCILVSVPENEPIWLLVPVTEGEPNIFSSCQVSLLILIPVPESKLMDFSSCARNWAY